MSNQSNKDMQSLSILYWNLHSGFWMPSSLEERKASINIKERKMYCRITELLVWPQNLFQTLIYTGSQKVLVWVRGALLWYKLQTPPHTHPRARKHTTHTRTRTQTQTHTHTHTLLSGFITYVRCTYIQKSPQFPIVLLKFNWTLKHWLHFWPDLKLSWRMILDRYQFKWLLHQHFFSPISGYSTLT